MSSKNGTTGQTGGPAGGGSQVANQVDQQTQQQNQEKAKQNVAKTVEQEMAKGNELYGGAASQAAKDSLVASGAAKVGSYFVQQGGEFIRVSKDQYDAAKAAGQKVSTSITGQNLQERLYGQSGVMGSGDSTGILSSTAISQKMFERQRNIKLAIAGGLAMAGVPGIPSAMLYDSMRTDYEGYLDRFNKNMTSTSIAASSNRTTDSGSTSGVTNDATITNQNQDAVLEEELRQNRIASLTGSGGVDAERRSLLATNTRTITGSMV
jgi:hypothetical protein